MPATSVPFVPHTAVSSVTLRVTKRSRRALSTEVSSANMAALEQEAEEKGGVQQVLADHSATVYKISMPLGAMA